VNGTEIRVIAGTTNYSTTGPIANKYVDPVYMDIALPESQVFEQTVDTEDNAFIFVIEGELSVGNSQNNIGHRILGILSEGDQVIVTAKRETQFLFASARSLNEPVTHGGPFVMNTKAEVLQAFKDFQNNRF